MARDKKKGAVNSLAERLYNAMFAYWRGARRKEGFEEKHEQELYDAVCKYRSAEKTWLK